MAEGRGGNAAANLNMAKSSSVFLSNGNVIIPLKQGITTPKLAW